MKKDPVSRYLDELIDYGGIPTTRGEAILDMQSSGMDQAYIDRWLQGQELMARLQRQREQVSVKLLVVKSPRRRQRSITRYNYLRG